MRQITIDAIRAFRNGYDFKRGNTQVKTYAHSNYRELLLHGNVIADMNEDGLYISMVTMNLKPLDFILIHLPAQ